VGTGPWRFGGWNGEQIVLERNEQYHGGPAPYIETLVYNIYSTLESAVTALTQGKLDYLAGIPDLALAELEKTVAKNYNFVSHPDLSYDYLGFNFREDAFGRSSLNPLRDPLVRQAIAAAIHRQDLVDQVLGGRGQVVHSPVPRGSWALAEEAYIDLHSFNPARAQALLEQAGWTLDQEGYRAKNGQRLELTITLNGDSPRQVKLAQMIKNNLRSVGLDIGLIKVAWEDLLYFYVYPGNYHLVLFGWSLGADPDAYSIFHSSQAAGGLNFGAYANETVDALSVLGRNTLESLQAELSLDLPYTFLFSRDLTSVVRMDVRGIVSSPLGLIALESWYIKNP
jgi:peptide/nickel transport system substrate-binding protein